MSAIRRWTVRSDPTDCGWFAWFYVYIYETAAELRSAATKYSPELGNNYFVDTLGCFQPSYTVKYDKKGKVLRCANTAFIGVMRFCTEALKPHIVIHESVHAATHYVCALKLQTTFVLGDNIVNEEALAYAAHEFSTSLLQKLEMLK